MKSTKRYDKEFKLHAVKQVLEKGKTQAEVSRELDVSKVSLHTWIETYKEDTQEPFVGSGNQRQAERDEKALLKRLKELEEENEILKKAVGFIARSQK